MPYTIKWTDSGVIWSFFGAVTSGEALRSNLEIYGDRRFDSIRYQIADFTQAESVDFSEKDLRKIAYLDIAASRTNPRIKVAIVTPNRVAEHFLQEYEKHARKGPWTVRLFDDLEAAESWVRA